MNPYQRDTFLSGMLRQGDRFIGLRDELEMLITRVSDQKPAAVSLVGQWGVGKSFLLVYMANLVHAQSMFVPLIGARFRHDPEALLFVLLDFEERAPELVAPKGQLLELLFDETLITLGRVLHIDDPRSLPLDRLQYLRPLNVSTLRDQIQRELRLARESADEQELYDRFDAALGPTQPGKLIELLKRMASWGLRVIFLMDDFDAIAGKLSRASFDHLRALLSAASMVVATRQALSDIVPVEVQTSSFFGLIDRLNLFSLQLLALDDARRVISEPPTWVQEQPTFRFSESDIAFILDLTGLHFDLIRVTCENLYRWTHRRPRTAYTDMIPVEEQAAFRARLHTLFADAFAALYHPLGSAERSLLQLIATQELPIANAEQFAPTPLLLSLINRGYVVYDTGRYRLFAGLFRDYVRGQDKGIPSELPIWPSIQIDQQPLTDLEQQLFTLLKANANTIIDRATIVETLYNVQPDAAQSRTYANRLDALMFRLRNKLAQQPVLIENIRGQGYRLIWTRQNK